MFSRLLSYNADFVDDQQSHWNIPVKVKTEMRVSFFVPCLRSRFECMLDFEFWSSTILRAPT